MVSKDEAQELHEHIGYAKMESDPALRNQALDDALALAAMVVTETDYELCSTRISAMREALFLIYSAPDPRRANLAADMLIRIASDGIKRGDWNVELGSGDSA
jgi:hypothetical protein